MTTQELVERLRSYQAYCPQTDRSDHPICTEAADRLSEMDAENKRLREALGEIAKQVPAKDMDEDYYEAADFEDGYDRCVFAARAALEHQQKGEGL